MVRGLVVMLILVVAGTGAFFGWRSQHRTDAEALVSQVQDMVDSAMAMLPTSDK